MARFEKSLIFVLGYLATCAYSQLLPSNAPDKTQEGQTGTNKCGTQSSQTSMCQNSFLNSIDDFCLYAPPQPGPGSVIGNTEREEVSWCIKEGYGTRLIPDGAITGAHFIETPDFVQITGVGDLTLLNVPKGDAGGELDPHGADGNGNPIGGLVFSSAFGQLEQILEWTMQQQNFMSDSQFCFRACKPGPRAAALCQHIYDVMGCEWNMPGNYGTGFTSCQAEDGEPMGVYGASTFFQGQPVTPAAHPAPSSSNCVTTSTIANGFVVTTTSPGGTVPKPSNSQVTSSSSSPSSPSSAPSSPLTPASETSPLSTVQATLTTPQVVSGSTGGSTPTATSAGAATTSPSAAQGSIDGLNRFVATICSTLTVGMAAAFFLL
ncbi:hypothetical protein D9756_006715 [Leucocoprinus leucothites]|uniref:Carbohydrate-binding module family 13 protein n=1 Tax=Leucocoprinus leucothites TaxID=201217 RepID=A0A8H5G2C7_9AGAR|nr:hypothetical protein D9756_006715 [Leucoagaricus leucothites]